MTKTLVMKFGGAAVATPQHFSQIAMHVIARKQEFSRLIVVVSAMGQTTDQLIQMAKEVHPNPPQREYDMLISAGERISMSLLAMALCQQNQEAISFTGSQSGIITCGRHAEARIIDVRPYRLKTSLDQGKIVIVAGFQGVSLDKEVTTLGRGGSDTSAVALGIAFEADQVEFLKDVPGIFDVDPKQNKQALHLTQLNYDEALTIANQGAKILHPRAIALAAKNGLPLQVRSFMATYQHHPVTWICHPHKKREKVPLYEEIINER